MRVVATTVIVSTWDLDTFEDIQAWTSLSQAIVSTWDLDTFEGEHPAFQ